MSLPAASVGGNNFVPWSNSVVTVCLALASCGNLHTFREIGTATLGYIGLLATARRLAAMHVLLATAGHWVTGWLAT